MTQKQMKFLLDDAVAKINGAKTPEERFTAEMNLKATKAVINAYQYHADAMKRLS